MGNEILIEKMVQDKVVEMIIGIKIDNQFGPVIVIGAGGIYTDEPAVIDKNIVSTAHYKHMGQWMKSTLELVEKHKQL